MAWAIGIDLGGTAIKIAVVDAVGNMVGFERHPTQLEYGPQGIVAQLASLVGTVYSRCEPGFGRSTFAGIGLGVPGAVDASKGVLSYPPNLPGWECFGIRDALHRELAASGICPPTYIAVDNDANIAAFGEAVFGAGRAFDDFMMVTLGTGVGGGIVLQRRIYRGGHGTAGEIGYLTVDYQGETVHAGVRGTVESLIGKAGISRLGRARYRKQGVGPEAAGVFGSDLDRLSPRTLEAAARAGDPVAREVWHEVGGVLGVALAGVVALMDVRKFLVGGGVSVAADLFIDSALDQMRVSTLTSMHDGIEVIPASLGNQAGVYGAAALCFERG